MLDQEFLKYLRFTKSYTWSKYLSERKIPISDVFYDSKRKQLYVRPVDHFFSKGDYPIFFDGYEKYFYNLSSKGFEFSFGRKDLFLKKDKLVFKIDTLEELYIINEIFVDEVYNFEANSEYLVIDIGMNVGLAALYFSQFENIKYVFGFEPFVQTYESALKNFEFNAMISHKIQTFNYGLSDKDQSIDLPYNSQIRGSMGIKNMTEICKDGCTETIILKEASTALIKIIEKHKSYKIVVKIDCEGSEYDIIESLEKSSILSLFDMYIIEWHKMPEYEIKHSRMINLLKSNGFIVTRRGEITSEIGLIYAFKQSCCQ